LSYTDVIFLTFLARHHGADPEKSGFIFFLTALHVNTDFPAYTRTLPEKTKKNSVC